MAWGLSAAEDAIRRTITLDELDRRLSHLTWSEIGLAETASTPIDTGRRRNRFATLGPEITAARKTLSRTIRLRALRYLLREVRGLRATLAANGQLTVIELTRAGRAFGRDPGPLGDHVHASAGRSVQVWSALHDALASEEALLVETIKAVRRAPDPVPLFKPGQMRWLSLRQLARLLAAARHELRDDMLVLGLAAHFYETNPPRGATHLTKQSHPERVVQGFGGRPAPKYTRGANRDRLVRILCKGGCSDRGRRTHLSWAEVQQPFPGPEVAMTRLHVDEYTAICLRCGSLARDPYNWWWPRPTRPGVTYLVKRLVAVTSEAVSAGAPGHGRESSGPRYLLASSALTSSAGHGVGTRQGSGRSSEVSLDSRTG